MDLVGNLRIRTWASRRVLPTHRRAIPERGRETHKTTEINIKFTSSKGVRRGSLRKCLSCFHFGTGLGGSPSAHSIAARRPKNVEFLGRINTKSKQKIKREERKGGGREREGGGRRKRLQSPQARQDNTKHATEGCLDMVVNLLSEGRREG